MKNIGDFEITQATDNNQNLGMDDQDVTAKVENDYLNLPTRF